MGSSETSAKGDISSCKCLPDEKPKITDLTLYRKEPQKEQTEPKASGGKDMRERREKTERKSKRENEWNQKPALWKAEQTDEPLAWWTKECKTQIIKIRSENGDVITESTEMRQDHEDAVNERTP